MRHAKNQNSPSLEAAKPIDDLKTRLKLLVQGTDKAGEFYRHFHYGLFSYISHRIPEISDDIIRVDDAMMAGFGWEIGAFESWDVLGVEETAKKMKEAGYKVAPWVEEMISCRNQNHFIKLRMESSSIMIIGPKSYKPVPGGDAFIVMKNFVDKIVWKNSACKLIILVMMFWACNGTQKWAVSAVKCLKEFRNQFLLQKKNIKGLSLPMKAQNFSAGANVGMIFMFAIEQEYDELDMAIRMFQNTMMRARYSSIPVVVAPHGLALGGACELSLHADKVCPAAETYMGLVELGVGLIPGGGGTKEFALRAADEMHEDEPETITLKNRFLTIATAKVATSAFEGFDIGVLQKRT